MGEPGDNAAGVRRVLVGCDLSEASRVAAQLALAVAARMGAEVELVLAWASSPRLPVTQARPKAHQDLKDFAATLRWPAGLNAGTAPDIGAFEHSSEIVVSPT